MFRPNKSAYTIVVIVLLLCVIMGYTVFNHANYPEKAILGSWKEVSWTYTLGEGEKDISITEEERHSIANHLIIHASEKWSFRKDYTLNLAKKGNEVHHAKWHLLGRGHILKIINDKGLQELYSIESLSKNKMILHFETDVQARGLVKITLIRS